MDLLFTSFDTLLQSSDVFSAFIDATLFAVDGLSDDGHQPTPYSMPLLWQQGAAELSIAPINQINYITLADILAGLQAVELTFSSVRNGMYATRFNIYVSNHKIGSGKIASRPPSPGRQNQVSSLSTNSTDAAASSRRALTLPPDPLSFRVDDTPISLFVSSYREALPLADQLHILLQSMFAAAGAIRDSGGDVLIGRSWIWAQSPVQLNLYPRVNMSWRSLATAAKGMKDFLFREGQGLNFRFEVLMDLEGRLGMGRMGTSLGGNVRKELLFM